jgi:hypothetical protein
MDIGVDTAVFIPDRLVAALQDVFFGAVYGLSGVRWHRVQAAVK